MVIFAGMTSKSGTRLNTGDVAVITSIGILGLG